MTICYKWHGHNVTYTSVVKRDTTWMNLTWHKPMGSCRAWDSAGREGKASMPVNFKQDELLQFPRFSKTIMESGWVKATKALACGMQSFWVYQGYLCLPKQCNPLWHDKWSALCSALQNVISWRIFQLFTVYLVKHVYFHFPSCTMCQSWTALLLYRMHALRSSSYH